MLFVNTLKIQSGPFVDLGTEPAEYFVDGTFAFTMTTLSNFFIVVGHYRRFIMVPVIRARMTTSLVSSLRPLVSPPFQQSLNPFISLTSRASMAAIGASFNSSNLSSASAWAAVRGNPSKKKTPASGFASNAELIIPITTSSGTSWP